MNYPTTSTHYDKKCYTCIILDINNVVRHLKGRFLQYNALKCFLLVDDLFCPIPSPIG